MDNYDWTAQARISTESGQTWVLRYYIHNYAADCAAPLYGLRVEKRGETGELAEAETTPAFTAYRDEAVRLAELFAKGTVPPCTLLEMTDEWFETETRACSH